MRPPLLLGCLALAVVARAELPRRVTVCELRKDPAAYNHQLLELTGFVSTGFEDSTLLDPSCAAGQNLWIEYRDGTIEGTPVKLERSETFRRFASLIRRKPDRMVHGTFVARFFAGREFQTPLGPIWGGYGHRGAFSLLAVERVVEVGAQDRADLDYRSGIARPAPARAGCSTASLLPEDTAASMIAAQREAEAGPRGWAFDDPRRVAEEGAARVLGMEPASMQGLRQLRKSPGRLTYEWLSADGKARYTLIAARPYWLSFFARPGGPVAWALVAAHQTRCG